MNHEWPYWPKHIICLYILRDFSEQSIRTEYPENKHAQKINKSILRHWHEFSEEPYAFLSMYVHLCNRTHRLDNIYFSAFRLKKCKYCFISCFAHCGSLRHGHLTLLPRQRRSFTYMSNEIIYWNIFAFSHCFLYLLPLTSLLCAAPSENKKKSEGKWNFSTNQVFWPLVYSFCLFMSSSSMHK